MSRNATQHLGILICLSLAPLLNSSADAQFGGGGFGGEGFAGVMNQSIMIEPSKSGKTLYGYSEELGAWDKLSAEPHPDDGLTPILTSSMAVVRGKNQLHVFKEETGKWISSPEIKGAISPPIVSAGVAAAVAGDQLWAVGKGQTTWVAVDLGELVNRDQVAVYASRVVYRTDSHVHVFSAASGKWASVDLTKD